MGACNWSCETGTNMPGGFPDGCGNSCTGNCLGECGGECNGCENDCTGSCSDDCARGCSHKCTGSDCSGECLGHCTAGCNVGCKTDVALELQVTLKNILKNTLTTGLHEIIYQTDMIPINSIIQNEAQDHRFGKNKTIPSVNFIQYDSIPVSKFKQLQNNLITLHPDDESYQPKEEVKIEETIWRKMGQELIDLALKSFETEIPSDLIG